MSHPSFPCSNNLIDKRLVIYWFKNWAFDVLIALYKSPIKLYLYIECAGLDNY